MECGPDEACNLFVHLLKEFEVPTSDWGEEFGLSVVRLVPIMSVFPWLSVEHGNGIQGFVDNAEEDIHDVSIGLNDSLPNPGLLHIIHNMANGLPDRLPELDAAVDGFCKVVDVV